MLKDKYTFKYNSAVLSIVNTCLMESLQLHSDTKSSVCCLCMLTLKPIVVKTSKMLCDPKPNYKVSLSRAEAVAFHLSYKKSYIDTGNIFIKEIFTQIDRTIA